MEEQEDGRHGKGHAFENLLEAKCKILRISNSISITNRKIQLGLGPGKSFGAPVPTCFQRRSKASQDSVLLANENLLGHQASCFPSHLFSSEDSKIWLRSLSEIGYFLTLQT